MGAPEHTCATGNREIIFSKDGVVILRFIRCCNGDYWGGSTAPVRTSADPLHHMTVTLHWMLGQIARSANDHDHFYEISGHGWHTPISKRMEADRIAGPLACTENEVRRYFSLSVEIPAAEVEVASAS